MNTPLFKSKDASNPFNPLFQLIKIVLARFVICFWRQNAWEVVTFEFVL